MGPMTYGEEDEEVFLGRSVTQHNSVSDETARKIDTVVRGILDRAYSRSKQLLTENIEKLHMMAEALLTYETIDVRQIDPIMEGRVPPPPLDWISPAAGAVPPKDGSGPKPNPLGGPAPTV
jgi:cell division protease FtsH